MSCTGIGHTVLIRNTHQNGLLTRQHRDVTRAIVDPGFVLILDRGHQELFSFCAGNLLPALDWRTIEMER